jgi:hypothetical protein
MTPADATATQAPGPHVTPTRLTGVPSDNTGPAPPRIIFEPAIGVTTMRLVGKDKSLEGSQNAEPPPKCSVQILHKQPTASARQLATFKIDATPAQRGDVLTVLEGKACEGGANALLIKDARQEESQAGPVYHVEAIAFFVEQPKTAAKTAPAPKTITLPPPSLAVPKTITVDSGVKR